MMREKLYRDNDNLLELNGLYDPVTTTYLNAATVSARVVTTAGAEVISAAAIGALSYVAASNGNYRVSVDKTVFSGLAIGELYDIEFTAVEAGLDYERLVRVVFVERRE